MGILRRALLALLFVIGMPAAASAEERITRFVSQVQVRPDASLDVTETLDVVAENVDIKRGIFRDFPTRYRGRRGNQVRVDFTLQGVTRDGLPEPAAVEPIRRGVRVRIGDPDKLLPIGEHRYVIRYRTTRQIGFFPEYDELYWNVTGHGWRFPIDSAEAHISLPQRASFGQRAYYTGAGGSTEQAAEVTEERPGEIRFRATRPLGPEEGLTVAVAWPKGIVAEPPQSRWWLIDYGPLAAGALALLGLCAFYYVAWQRAGRNPRPGTVVPLFSPPDDLSPSAMRYVLKMGADNRAFAAALVNLGVKGHVRMVEEDGGWFGRDKVRLERLHSTTPVDPSEEAMIRELVTTGDSIVMEQKNHARFSAAQKGLSEILKKRFEGTMFRRNWGWAFAGLVLFVAALWIAAAAVVAAAGAVDPMMLAASIGAITATAMVLLLVQDAQAVGKCLLVGLAFLFGSVAVGTGMPIVGAAFDTGWWEPLALPLLGLPLVVSSFFWIAAPTREGRKVLDRIAGFRQYLSITEGQRLDRLTPPEDTPELFERYLPYAIALGVENRWAERFSGVLAAAAVQGRQGFTWYSGSSSPWSNPSGFASSVSSSLASTLGSASTAPGSSSGSGGGGSSGGGGGGGGGGGW